MFYALLEISDNSSVLDYVETKKHIGLLLTFEMMNLFHVLNEINSLIKMMDRPAICSMSSQHIVRMNILKLVYNKLIFLTNECTELKKETSRL